MLDAGPRTGLGHTGTAITELLDGNLGVVRLRGHMSKLVIEAALQDVRALITRGARAFILDTTGVSGFDTDIRSTGFELLSTLRRRGVAGAAAAVTSPAVRMLASAIAFGTGLPVEFFPTFDQARACAAQLAATRR